MNYLNDPKLAIPIWIRIWLRIRIKMKVGSEFRKNTQESPHCPDSYYCRNSREKLCDLLLTSNYMRDKNMRILPELYIYTHKLHCTVCKQSILHMNTFHVYQIFIHVPSLAVSQNNTNNTILCILF